MSLVPLDDFTMTTDTQTLANSCVANFTATRDGSGSDNNSLFSYKESSAGSEWLGSATRRGHLITFTPSVFGLVKSVVQVGEVYFVRLGCPNDVTCKIKATFVKQLKILEEILVMESTEENSISSSWFKHERHVAPDVDDAFYVELIDPDDEWELSSNSLVGLVLGMWVTLHRREVRVESSLTNLAYCLKSDFFAITETEEESPLPDCDNDKLPCRFCGRIKY